MFVVFRSDPLGATAITDLRRLQRDLPGLARRVGLRRARLQYAGQTAIAAEAAQLTAGNLELILLAAFGVEFVLLGAYLRALVTPLVLLAGSALVVGASGGLATLVFGGGDGLTFYAPFSAAVLLVALGSDYNVFAVGGIWEEPPAGRSSRRCGRRCRAPPGRSPPRGCRWLAASPWSRSSRSGRSGRSRS